MRVMIRAPRKVDEAAFLDAVHRSRGLHRRWIFPPTVPAEYHAYLARTRRVTEKGYLLRLCDGGEIVGVVNLSVIVRGLFCSAYLGFYAFVPHAGRGLMTEGLALVVDKAFRDLKLHRLEANVQPKNHRSIALVRRLGFREEGFSPRYLRIDGRWRDHLRFAILADEWRPPRDGHATTGGRTK